MVELPINQILQGDVLENLKEFPEESVDCIVTSPPYYGLRDYGIEGQIGLESSLQEYLDKMLKVTNELKRVLKKTGTMWWNHGDSYASLGKLGGDFGKEGKITKGFSGRRRVRKGSYPEKSLLLQNFRLIQRMIDEQKWILRNVIIWHKPNCMPSSVKDRFTVDFEPVFFLTKSKRYYFEPQYEAHTDLKGFQKKIKSKFGSVTKTKGLSGSAGTQEGGFNDYLANKEVIINPLSRNKRTVWKISTQPYSEAHFATFPEKLVETPIKAGCPEFICKKCGKAREKVFEVGEQIPTGHGGSKSNQQIIKKYRGESSLRTSCFQTGTMAEKIDKGYSDCGCNAGWDKGIVLDCFMGSGTTALVARSLGRNYIGIELNEKYIKLAEKRLVQQVLL